jgi:hypothetical protein
MLAYRHVIVMASMARARRSSFEIGVVTIPVTMVTMW